MVKLLYTYILVLFSTLHPAGNDFPIVEVSREEIATSPVLG